MHDAAHFRPLAIPEGSAVAQFARDGQILSAQQP
jgi:hypothetical protein